MNIDAESREARLAALEANACREGRETTVPGLDLNPPDPLPDTTGEKRAAHSAITTAAHVSRLMKSAHGRSVLFLPRAKKAPHRVQQELRDAVRRLAE